MARLRRATTVTTVRAELAAGWRAFAADFAERLEIPPARVGAYLARADALDRGEPVDVASWEVSRHLPGRLSGLPYRWTVEPDGELRPAADDERRVSHAG